MEPHAPLSRDWPPSIQQVTAAQNGDERLLSGILATGIPKLVAFYRGMGLVIQDAEDLASDTCEALVRSISKLRDPARFEPWFWKVARSKFYDHLRQKRRGSKPADREEMYDDPSDSLIISAEHDSIRLAFQRLRSKDQELIWMRDVIGLAYTDISGRLGMREGAIRVALMRARQRLEEALAEIERDSGD